MTDFHTLDELIEARKLLADLSGILSALNDLGSPCPQTVRDRRKQIDAFLARPLYGKGS